MTDTADEAGQNKFVWGIWIRPASADFPPAGWGGMRAGFGLEVFAAEFRARKPGASPIKNAIFQKKRA